MTVEMVGTENKEQKAENIREWVRRLRSGEYLQGPKYLRRRMTDEVEVWCCLGIACEIAEPDAWALPPDSPSAAYRHHGTRSMPRKSVMSEHFGIRMTDADLLARMNDSGSDFYTIAEYIEDKILPNVEELGFS